MANKTKIIATIGPSSTNKTVLKQMIEAGMNVARLNFSHGNYQDHAGVIRRIRGLSRVMNKPVAILLDLQGPKIRTGRLKDDTPVMLKKKAIVRITTKKISGTADIVSTTYANLIADVKRGKTILLDDGLIELVVMSKTADTVKCRVINGGILKENKGINLPGVNVSAPALTEKDKKDLNFGIKLGIDYIALSFLRSAADLKQIRSILKKQHADIPVIAKIEKPEAVNNLEEILKASDGIMVARGDLGVELKPEQVPTIQKNIIKNALMANKPVITATQMLESMIDNPVPTRAEASDVANAIFDSTDAIMLSGETASGKYSVEAVKMMARIAAEAENAPFMKYNLQHERDQEDIVSHAVAQSSVNILHEIGAKAIIAFSVSGKTAKLISKQRSSKPVYVFTPSMNTYNRMSLMWGIIPGYIPKLKNTQRLITAAENILMRKKHIKKDDVVVIVIGLAFKTGSTNLIKIHQVGTED